MGPVKHQRGHAELGERSAERLLNGAVDAAADKHAAAFHVHGADRVGEQHDGQDEPGSGLADVSFGFTAGVIGGRSQVVQDDGCGAPEGNEG
jgi:hypothetical protein